MIPGPLGSLAALKPWRTRRCSTFDRTGGNHDFTSMAPGETLVLADIKGAGIVRHIWMTLECRQDPLFKRGLLLKVHWDGCEEPSILSPIGDFFGQGWGMNYPFSSLPMAAAPDKGKAHICTLPMPFSDGARFELVNECGVEIDRVYAYLDYEEMPELPPDQGRLHAHYRQELTQPHTDGRENEWEALGPYGVNPSQDGGYLWLDVQGKGHFVGVNYYVQCPTPIWYGEGDDIFLIDGEPWPGLHGTGTEDYFNTSWSPDGIFMHPSFGIAYAPDRVNSEGRFGWIGKTHLFRWHMDDPVRFEKSLRATIEHGHANCLTLNLASVAYWYMEEAQGVPDLPPYDARKPLPDINVVDIHRWRDAWLREKGVGKRWGRE